MAKTTSLEAYDLLKFASSFHERLEAAQAVLEAKRGHPTEKQWLTQAIHRVKEVQAPADLLDRVRLLPELEELREEALEVLQAEWVDGLERLHAGITFHAGSRSPVIEALFPHLKFPALRRANVATANEYLADLERRMKSGYVTRMFGTPDFAFITPVLTQLQSSVARWRGFLAGESVEGIDVEALRHELLSSAKGVELAVRQARLLAEAAFAPWEGAFEEAELHVKLKKRVGKPAPVPSAESVNETESASEETSVDVSAEAAPAPSPSEPAPIAEAEPQAVEGTEPGATAEAAAAVPDVAGPNETSPVEAEPLTAPDLASQSASAEAKPGRKRKSKGKKEQASAVPEP